jgi:hypothetical protein
MARTGSGALFQVEYTFDAIDDSKRAGEVKFDVKQNVLNALKQAKIDDPGAAARNDATVATLERAHLANRSLGLLWPRRWNSAAHHISTGGISP